MGKEESPRDRKNLTTAFAVAVIVITILFIPMVPTKETYSEAEEYERQAKYEVVSVTFREETESQGTRIYHASIVVVKNIDANGGTFITKHYLYEAEELNEIKTTGEYLSAGQEKTFRVEFDTQGLQDVRGGYSVSPPVVIDKRIVMKTKTVYKSIIELLIYH